MPGAGSTVLLPSLKDNLITMLWGIDMSLPMLASMGLALKSTVTCEAFYFDTVAIILHILVRKGLPLLSLRNQL